MKLVIYNSLSSSKSLCMCVCVCLYVCICVLDHSNGMSYCCKSTGFLNLHTHSLAGFFIMFRALSFSRGVVYV